MKSPKALSFEDYITTEIYIALVYYYNVIVILCMLLSYVTLLVIVVLDVFTLTSYTMRIVEQVLIEKKKQWQLQLTPNLFFLI